MSRDSQTQIAFYVALIVACALSAQGSEIRLRGQCLATSSVVRLGDVAEFEAVASGTREQLHALALFPAPKIGLSRRVTAQDVREILSLHGFSLPEVKVTGQCRVEGSLGSEPSPSDIQSAGYDDTPLAATSTESINDQLALEITAYLVTKDRAHSQWKVDPLLSTQQANLLQAMEQPQVSGGQSPWTGRQVFTVHDAAAPDAEPVSIKADVLRIAKAVVSTRQLSVGDVIGESDVELAEVNPLSVTSSALLSLSDAVGWEVKRPLPPGQIVHGSSLRRPVLVRKGELVTVYSLAAGVQVKATAKALSDGSLGDVVVLQAAETKRQFQARVTASQEAMVFVDTPQVIAEDERPMADTSAAGGTSEVGPDIATRLP